METTSGLGVFVWALFEPHSDEIRHEEAGWLDSYEGSVTAVTAVAGSLLLVNG